MSESITVGLDMAKNVFLVHGADGFRRAVQRKKLWRDKVLTFFSQLLRCVVALEACGGAHFWGHVLCPQLPRDILIGKRDGVTLCGEV